MFWVGVDSYQGVCGMEPSLPFTCPHNDHPGDIYFSVISAFLSHLLFPQRACRTKNRKQDTDQIQERIEKAQETGTDPAAFAYDDELPGGGQFYCVETGRHFTDAEALKAHKKTREYKRRCKDLKEEKYTQDMADWAGGMTKEKLPPAHPPTEP